MTAIPLTRGFTTRQQYARRKHGTMRPVTDQTDQKDDELFQGPSIDADGRLEGRFQNVELPPPEPPPPAAAPAQEESPELDLSHRPVVEERVENFRPDMPPPPAEAKRSGALKLFVGFMLLGGLALGAFVYFRPHLGSLGMEDGVRSGNWFDTVTAGTEVPPIIISSTPTGANITINDKPVGQTPWAGDNRWVGQPTVTIQLPGYKTWEGKLQGGEPQTLDITLKK